MSFRGDPSLKLDSHVNTVVKSCFFQLRQLSKIKPLLVKRNLERDIHAFISSHLNYCSALFIQLTQASVAHLQLMQNATGGFLSCASKSSFTHRFKTHFYSLSFNPVSDVCDLMLLLCTCLLFNFDSSFLFPYLLPSGVCCLSFVFDIILQHFGLPCCCF